MATLNPPVHSPAVSYSSSDIKPLPFGPAVLFFAIPSLVLVVSYHWGITVMVELGLTDFTAYMVATMIPLVRILVAAFVAHRLEGRPLTWAALSNRFRLRQISVKTGSGLWVVSCSP